MRPRPEDRELVSNLSVYLCVGVANRQPPTRKTIPYHGQIGMPCICVIVGDDHVCGKRSLWCVQQSFGRHPPKRIKFNRKVEQIESSQGICLDSPSVKPFGEKADRHPPPFLHHVFASGSPEPMHTKETTALFHLHHHRISLRLSLSLLCRAYVLPGTI
jgi:hypothetical protein